MTPVVILLVVLLCFWAFVRWDRNRLNNAAAEPLSREQMNKGFTPSAAFGWPFSFGLGALCAWIAFAEWQSPSQRPYSGRWAWLSEALYRAFGPKGIAGFFAVGGLVAIGYGLVRWWQSRAGSNPKAR